MMENATTVFFVKVGDDINMGAKEELIEIPKKEYEAMKETLEILSDVKTAVRILKSIEQAEAGETISEKEFVRKFAL